MDETGQVRGIRDMQNCLHAAQCHPQGSGRLVTETFMIAAADPDIKLHVRYKRHTGQDSCALQLIVLFVRGASYLVLAGL